MYSLPIVELSAKEHLKVLQRLDRAHEWHSVREQRRCRACGDTFSGREIEIVGGTRGYGPLRLQCPTSRCGRGPESWQVIVPAGRKLTAAPDAVKVSHGGRAWTLRRIKHLEAHSPSASGTQTTIARVGAAVRRLGQLLHVARERTAESANTLSHSLTRG
jgi:hypothetical protein